MKKWIDNNLFNFSLESTKTLQTESTWNCATANAKHLVVKVTHLVPGPFKWNNNMRHIYLCKCILKIFIAWTCFSHPWLWPTYVKSRFAFIRTVEIKSLCLQLKRSGTKYAAQKINFLISAVANGPPLRLWKVSLGSDEVLMCYYLFFIPSICPAHAVRNFIDFDWFGQLFRALFDLKLLIFKPL